MAHWFHRNPLKATAPATFELRGVATNGNTQKICSELRQSRIRILDLIANPNNEPSVIEEAIKKYVSLLHGFLFAIEGNNSGDSKLRHLLRFRWTNTLLGNTPTEVFDAYFEVISIVLNTALWYTKHAAKTAAKDEPSLEEAKEVHCCLRRAAGMFKYVKDELVARLVERPDTGTDLDPRVLEAYIGQTTAEAQEVTIARALELKHSPSLVSALAYETAQLFQSAECSLKSLDEKAVSTSHWRKYLLFKEAIYRAYAYKFHGENLLAEDKCGEAIRCLEESKKNYAQAGVLGKQYSSTKGPGTTARPNEHLFYRKLGPIVDRTLEKCVRENGFIYHHKVPPVAPDLELKATYGLVAPEAFEPPSASELWTPDVYTAFDITKHPQQNEKKTTDEKGDLPPVKESDVSQSNKDPNTSSGCSVQ